MESRSYPEEEVALSVFVNFHLFMCTAQLDLYTMSDCCLIKTDVWYFQGSCTTCVQADWWQFELVYKENRVKYWGFASLKLNFAWRLGFLVGVWNIKQLCRIQMENVFRWMHKKSVYFSNGCAFLCVLSSIVVRMCVNVGISIFVLISAISILLWDSHFVYDKRKSR